MQAVGGSAHLGVPLQAELQDHDLQIKTAMDHDRKSNVCKYYVP